MNGLDPSRKPSILMCVQQDFIHRDLHESGTLAQLAETFDLSFVVSGKVDETAVAAFGRVIARHRTDRVRLFLWSNLSILQSIRNWRPIIGTMARDYFNRKLPDNYEGMLPFLVAIERFGLAAPVTWVVDRILDLWLNRSMHARGQKHYDLVVAPTIMRDFVADDLVRWARKTKTPSLLVQMNLDNFNIKVPTIAADAVAVWGDQSWYFARLVHHYKRDSIFVVGSPRHDGYSNTEYSKSEARQALRLPHSDRIILFCGATTVFDESQALAELDQAIETDRLPRETIILYKPHPRGMAKGSGRPFDPSEFRHVQLYQSVSEAQWTPLKEYGALFAAVDAVITPFSTMGVEAGLTGLPVLCVGYHKERPAYWRFAEFLHLKTYYDNGWSLVCTNPEDLINRAEQLIARIDDPDARLEAYRMTGTVVYRDRRHYAQRLRDAMLRMIDRQSRPIDTHARSAVSVVNAPIERREAAE